MSKKKPEGGAPHVPVTAGNPRGAPPGVPGLGDASETVREGAVSPYFSPKPQAERRPEREVERTASLDVPAELAEPETPAASPEDADQRPTAKFPAEAQTADGPATFIGTEANPLLQAPTLIGAANPLLQAPTAIGSNPLLRAPTLIGDAPNPLLRAPTAIGEGPDPALKATLEIPTVDEPSSAPSQDSAEKGAEGPRAAGAGAYSRQQAQETAGKAKRAPDAEEASTRPLTRPQTLARTIGAAVAALAALAFVGSFALRRDAPVRDELNLAYPYGLNGAKGPMGERAPPVEDLTFEYVEELDSVGSAQYERCQRWRYRGPGPNEEHPFEGTMVVCRRWDKFWERFGEEGMPFRQGR